MAEATRAGGAPYTNDSLSALRDSGQWERLRGALRKNAEWLWDARPDKRWNGTPEIPEHPVKLLRAAADELSTWHGTDIPPDPHMAPLGHPVDEYGRSYEGVSSDVLAQAFDMTLTGLTFVPGWGTAVSIGLRAAWELGRGESLQDAALSAARDSLPGGEPARAAFDVGVGLARGDGLSATLVSAARGQVPPEYRDAFDRGISLAQ